MRLLPIKKAVIVATSLLAITTCDHVSKQQFLGKLEYINCYSIYDTVETVHVCVGGVMLENYKGKVYVEVPIVSDLHFVGEHITVLCDVDIFSKASCRIKNNKKPIFSVR